MLIRCDVLPIAAPPVFCGFTILLGDLAVRHLLVCNEDETWLPGRFDTLVALPPLGRPITLVWLVWL